MYVKFFLSPRTDKKMVAIFYDDDRIIKKVHFGSKSMSDYSIHKDINRKKLFLNRFHRLIQKYKNDKFSPMTLSHLILWNHPDLETSINDYKRKFNLK